MKFPVLNELPAVKDNTEEFKGYNHNLRTEPGEWFNQKNMTTDFYPAASPREKRSLQKKNEPSYLPFINRSIYIEDPVSLIYLDNRLFTLSKVKANTFKREVLGYWFFSDGAPLIEYLKNIVKKINGVTVNASFDYSTRIATVEFSNIERVEYSINDKINFRYSYSHTYCPGIGYVVTSVSKHSFVCQKDYTSESGGYSIKVSGTNIDVDFSKYEDEDIFYKILSLFNANNENYRTLIRMGSYICAFPDGVIFETANEDEDVPVFPIKQKKEFEARDEIVFETSIVSGDDYAPISLGSNTYRYEDGKIQKYLTDQALWVNQETFVKIYKEGETGTFELLNVGDSINIAYDEVSPPTPTDPYSTYNNIESGIFDKNTKQANVKIIKKGTIHGQTNTDYIVVRGFIAGFHGRSPGYGSYRIDEKLKGVSIERKAPDFANIVCESQNRLWACSRDGHEIYASALGNPYNWYDYSGLSTDSYAVNVGTYGEFTGCINYLGRPLFFKENALHIISGSYPSNGGEIDGMSYSVATTTEFKGVEKGSEKSLAIIDNILYYKASAGIVAFDGTNTVVISDALGKEKYKNAVAGAYNNNYYVSMQDRNGLYHLFVYDTELGTWCREDNTHVLQFINVNNELLYLNADDNKIYSVTEENILNTTDYDKEGNFEWSCETGNFGYSYPNNKYLSRFQVRMQIADGAKATFFIQYDSNGVWHRKGEMTGKGIRTHLFPIIPVRCDHMKIKIEGKGDVKIFSISKILEEGGDV